MDTPAASTWAMRTEVLLLDIKAQFHYEFGKGDFVTFPKGLSCIWDIKAPVRKHYNFK